jgi:GNAT superfamily N-acetyltransferase
MTWQQLWAMRKHPTSPGNSTTNTEWRCPGLVIRYAYLWRSDAAPGLEEGTKDRPCAVLAIRRAGEQIRVVVAPITHRPPSHTNAAVEIPAQTKERLQLDHERSWVVTDEVNIFTWPGPDLRLIDNAAPRKGVVYGYLPEKTTRRSRSCGKHERRQPRRPYGALAQMRQYRGQARTAGVDTSKLKHRLATRADLGALKALMEAAIAELQQPFLSAAQIESSRGIMGLDTLLVDDGTYFVVEQEREIAGCGGWSRRATLYGGDRSPGRDPALLDPARDSARVRAMYTHPAFTRRGVGRLILSLCEDAARAEGFTRAELMATLAGEPLYRACGYVEVERLSDDRGGVAVPLVRMVKMLA